MVTRQESFSANFWRLTHTDVTSHFVFAHLKIFYTAFTCVSAPVYFYAMATMERPRSRPAVTTATLTREADDYMKRAAKLQENQQHDEAAVLYRRVVSLINAHEDTATVDDNLKAMKRHANQLLLQSTVRRNHATSSDAAYQNMVRQLSMHTAEADEDQDAAAASAEAGQNPPAYEAVATEADLADSSASVVFQLDTGAKIFYLAKDGSIQTTSETLPLTIFQAA